MLQPFMPARTISEKKVENLQFGKNRIWELSILEKSALETRP